MFNYPVFPLNTIESLAYIHESFPEWQIEEILNVEISIFFRIWNTQIASSEISSSSEKQIVNSRDAPHKAFNILIYGNAIWSLNAVETMPIQDLRISSN